MTKTELVNDILAVYSKHGWQAVEAILLEDSNVAPATLGGIPVRRGPFDAVWFKRPSRKGMTALELRLLSKTPYAIFELAETDSEEDVNRIKDEVEERMAEFSDRKP